MNKKFVIDYFYNNLYNRVFTHDKECHKITKINEIDTTMITQILDSIVDNGYTDIEPLYVNILLKNGYQSLLSKINMFKYRNLIKSLNVFWPGINGIENIPTCYLHNYFHVNKLYCIIKITDHTLIKNADFQLDVDEFLSLTDNIFNAKKWEVLIDKSDKNKIFTHVTHDLETIKKYKNCNMLLLLLAYCKCEYNEQLFRNINTVYDKFDAAALNSLIIDSENVKNHLDYLFYGEFLNISGKWEFKFEKGLIRGYKILNFHFDEITRIKYLKGVLFYDNIDIKSVDLNQVIELNKNYLSPFDPINICDAINFEPLYNYNIDDLIFHHENDKLFILCMTEFSLDSTVIYKNYWTNTIITNPDTLNQIYEKIHRRNRYRIKEIQPLSDTFNI